MGAHETIKGSARGKTEEIGGDEEIKSSARGKKEKVVVDETIRIEKEIRIKANRNRKRNEITIRRSTKIIKKTTIIIIRSKKVIIIIPKFI